MLIRSVCLLIACLLPAKGSAAIFCATNSSEFVAALAAAATNGESNTIRLNPGVFMPPDEDGFVFSFSGSTTLRIVGGYANPPQFNCRGQVEDPRVTIVDGDNLKRLFRFLPGQGNPEGIVTFSNLTFRNGYGPVGQDIGPVHVELPPSNTSVTFDGVLFQENSADSGAAVTALGLRRLTIRNSVFINNTVRENQGTVAVWLDRDDQRFSFVNNTMIGNSHQGTQSARCSGVHLSEPPQGTTPQTVIVNSVLWDNVDFDLCLPSAGDTFLFHSNIQNQLGTAMTQVNNLSIDPMLDPQPLSYTPVPGSPMINAGLEEPNLLLISGELPPLVFWSYGDFDFEYRQRVVGGQVDIGAVESTIVGLFCDRFEQGATCP